MFFFSQNILKKEIKEGAKTSMYYSPSQYKFANYSGQTTFVGEVIDNRSNNWNKQINDTVKVDLIRDFWSYGYTILLKNKINQDLGKAGVKTEGEAGAAQYTILPQVEIHAPNYVVYPQKGYYILTKLNMVVNKGGAQELKKSYQEYYYFNKSDLEYKDVYSTDYYEGTNAGMWVSMRRILDRFYSDLNTVFSGQQVSQDNTPWETKAKSNIADDPSLQNKQNSFANARDKNLGDKKVSDNYRIDEKPDLPVPTDGKLDQAINSLDNKGKTVNETITNKKVPAIDSNKLAEIKAKEEIRRRALDSAMKAKEELAKAARLKKEEDKKKTIDFANIDKTKKDSIIRANKLALAEKLREKSREDSVRRAAASKQMELAKQRREEERKKQIASGKIKEEIQPKSVTEAPKQNTATIASQKPNTPIGSSVNIAAEVRRIAREVELEESGKPVTMKGNQSITAVNPVAVNSSSNREEDEKKARKLRIEAEKVKLEAEKKAKEEMLVKLKEERANRLAKLESERKLKDSMVKVEIARKKAELEKKEEEKRLAAIKPIDPKKAAMDSIKLEEAKKKKREAILAAQKSAIEAEREALAKNPYAGEMFASVSTDPPSKLPDYRSREQVLADRIFTPKNDISKDLLNRVKLITPQEEMKMLETLKTTELSTVDSFFIEYQKNRPIPSPSDDTAAAPKAVKELEKKPSKSNKKELSKSSIKDVIKDSMVSPLDKKKAILDKALSTTKKESVDPKKVVAKETTSTSPKSATEKASGPIEKALDEEKAADKLNDDSKKKLEELKKKAEELKKKNSGSVAWD